MKKLCAIFALLLVVMISGCGSQPGTAHASKEISGTSATSSTDINISQATGNAGNNNFPTSSTISNNTSVSSGSTTGNSSASSSNSLPNMEVQVKIYLIKLNDNGNIGGKIDTGDSLVAVTRKISTPQTPLKAAFNALLAEPENGNTGLYNPLAKDKVLFENATITNGKAEVYLSGKVATGGEMDIPRVESQLKATALQFSTVKNVQIYINDKTIEEYLSLKGEGEQ